MSFRPSEGGFTLLELVVTVGIAGIVAAIAIPATSRTLEDLRLRGDARAIHNMVGVAKMRAGARFSRERLYVDLTTNAFFLQYWDKTASAWAAEGGSTTLSSGVNFSFGTISTPPPNTQDSLAQAPACLNSLGGTVSNSACVVFNSRGIPINATGGPFGNTAFYITDGETGVYAVTVSATPLVRLWWSPASNTSWTHK